MVNLGSLFPEHIIQQHIFDNFTVGSVIRIDVTFSHITKPKFLILVADNDPECLTFIINSETHPFVANRQDLAKCQVDIDAFSHSFLEYDSKIACHEILKLRRSDVIKELKQDSSMIKGRITNEVLSNILSAVKFAKTLSEQDKTVIISSLEKFTE